jgi:hypothetical protein
MPVAPPALGGCNTRDWRGSHSGRWMVFWRRVRPPEPRHSITEYRITDPRSRDSMTRQHPVRSKDLTEAPTGSILSPTASRPGTVEHGAGERVR